MGRMTYIVWVGWRVVLKELQGGNTGQIVVSEHNIRSVRIL